MKINRPSALVGAALKAVTTAIQKDTRFKYAEVEGHHDIMLIAPPRLASSLLSLA